MTSVMPAIRTSICGAPRKLHPRTFPDTTPPPHELAADQMDVVECQRLVHTTPLALASAVGAFRRKQPVRLDVDQDVPDLVPAPQPIRPVAQQLLDDLGIRHRQNPGRGNPEHEQRPELVGPAGNEAVQFVWFDVEGVTNSGRSRASKARAQYV